MANGNNGWVKWLVGSLFVVLTSVISVMGNNVIANENKRVKDAKEIRKEIKKGDEKVRDDLTKSIQRVEDKVEKVQDKVDEIRVEQQALVRENFRRSMEILSELKAIKKKVDE